MIADALAEIVGSRSQALPGATVAVLREVLFAALSDRHLRKVGKLAMLARYRADVAIVREGARGHDFFVILEGRATVARRGTPWRRWPPETTSARWRCSTAGHVRPRSRPRRR